MNRSKAIQNSVLYYELNMLNQLLKLNLISVEEYNKATEIATKDFKQILILR